MVSITPVLRLNGKDFSDILKEIHFKISHVKRTGNNGGMMKNGDTTVDLLAWKNVLTFETKGTTPARMGEFLNELLTDYVEVDYIDDRTNQETTGTFIPSETVEIPVGYFIDGAIGFYNATTITLTEK